MTSRIRDVLAPSSMTPCGPFKVPEFFVGTVPETIVIGVLHLG